MHYDAIADPLPELRLRRPELFAVAAHDERLAIVMWIASNPAAGDVIEGMGGARKVRFGGKGKGKSGGYRVITYYAREDIPVFLIDIYGKGRRSDISMAEKKVIRNWAATLERALSKVTAANRFPSISA